METQVQNKLKVIFNKVVEPNYVMDTYYTDNLINKFLQSNDPEISTLKAGPWLCELLVEAIEKSQHCHDSVKVFLSRMAAVACQSELNCLLMFCKASAIKKKVEIFGDIRTPNISPSLTVAYIDIALAIIKHNPGVMIILENGIWKQILSFTNNKKTVFILRKAYIFMGKFVWKLNDIGDEENLRLVLTYILKPLIGTDFMSCEEVDEATLECFEPVLNIIMNIVSEKNRIVTPSLLIQILVVDYKLSNVFFMIFDRTRVEETLSMLIKLAFWLTIGKVIILPNENICMEIDVIFYNTITFLIQKRLPFLVLDYCYTCFDIWNSLLLTTTNCKSLHDSKMAMHKKILVMCLIPPMQYLFKLDMKWKEGQFVEDFVNKILSSTCQISLKACYAFKNLVEEMDTVSITLQSVKRLTHLRRNLNDVEANLVFQALYHILKHYGTVDEDGEVKVEEDFEKSQENVIVMTYVLDAILQIVKNHDISWHMGLEVLCLYNIVADILNRPNLSCKFTVTALNIITITIKKFLPPNLSLLVESKPGQPIDEIGKLIYTKMHDMNWEVRDSALELLHVCTEISFIKFEPFKKQILDNNLINVATTIALHDSEPYVQSSALKCLASATKLPKVWEQLEKQYPDIQNGLILILRNNDEGIVRKEACNVLCEVYQNIKLTPQFKQYLYGHMVSSALADFHWEVQLSALRFWKIVIQKLLTDQGMLDGSFPSVTFSRQSRKIVSLNEAEIQRRLMMVLEELSSMGCLTVLTKHLYEDLEVDIMETALNISLDFMEILNKYNLPNNMNLRQTNVKIEDIVSKLITKEDLMDGIEEINGGVQPQEKVIEGILNDSDINILATIYSSHLNIDYKGPVDACSPKITVLQNATPELFVSFLTSKDHRDSINQKRVWKEGIRSISSLMDDVLGIYDLDGEINSADCY